MTSSPAGPPERGMSPSCPALVVTAARALARAYTSVVFAGMIVIAILGLALDLCSRGLLLVAGPSRRG